MIPAQVRYSAELPAGAKILYAEISSLTDARGFCFASNAYFCELYGLAERTLQRYLTALKNGGFIRIQDGDGGSGRRKIYAGINPLFWNPDKNVGVIPNPDKNVGGTPTKLSPNPDKIVADNMNNKKENKKEEQDPPIPPEKRKPPMPKELMEQVTAYAGENLGIRNALIDFAEMRAKRKKPISTQRTLTLLLSRLNELSGGSSKAKLAIIDKAILNGWLSFYPLDGGERPDSPGSDRAVEAPRGVASW